MSKTDPPSQTKSISKKKGGGQVRSTPKGRRVDPQALQEVLALLGDEPRRRDLLIEHLHKIQDKYRCLSAKHLVALASEMKMAMAEVYEVATFYHHFDVVKEGEAAPPAITVRVCDSVVCELAGSKKMLSKLPGLLGADVRVLHAPCVGRCETAPVAIVGQNPIIHATEERVAEAVTKGQVTHPADGPVTPRHIDYAAYRASGGYVLATECVTGKRKAADVMATMEDSGLRGLGGAGFPAGRKWKIVAAEPAPRMLAVNIDEGEPGTFKDPAPSKIVTISNVIRTGSSKGRSSQHGLSASTRSISISATNTTVAAPSCSARSQHCRPIRPARYPRFICAEAPALTSAAKSRR
jgi:formate dehydrogenase beta subunit